MDQIPRILNAEVIWNPKHALVHTHMYLGCFGSCAFVSALSVAGRERAVIDSICVLTVYSLLSILLAVPDVHQGHFRFCFAL